MKFSNGFSEFELPQGWSCALDGSAWTCQIAKESSRPDAVVVFAAKKKGEKDTPASFEELMSKPGHFKDADGKERTSTVAYSKKTEINGQVWIDALHSNSELVGYYTRYLATIRDDIAVLVTYSIEKSRYQEYVGQLDALIRSVKVFSALPASNPAATVVPQQLANAPIATGVPYASLPSGLAGNGDVPVQKLRTARPQENGASTLLLLLVLLIPGLWYRYKNYKKKKEENGE